MLCIFKIWSSNFSGEFVHYSVIPITCHQRKEIYEHLIRFATPVIIEMYMYIISVSKYIIKPILIQNDQIIIIFNFA